MVIAFKKQRTILLQTIIGSVSNAIIISLALLYSPSSNALDNVNLKPPGQLITINGRKIHIHCIGNKSPTIILDSGVGGFSLEWQKILDALSPYTRICAYDRAGYGWSDMGTLPRTTKKITKELHILLQTAGIHQPYIIVGHSFGGYTAQYFAQYFDSEVVGIVLIDSSHQEQVYRLPEKDSEVTRNSIYQERNIITKPILHEHFPKENALTALKLMHQWKSLLTWREEMASYALSAKQLRYINYRTIAIDKPLIVLSRGKRVWPNTKYGDAMENTWAQMQKELNDLSTNSTHIIAENSGHVIHLDQPNLVIDALHDILYTLEEYGD